MPNPGRSILTGENLVKVRNGIGLVTIPTPFQYAAQSTSRSNRAREGIKGAQREKEKATPALSAVIPHIHTYTSTSFFKGT